MGGWKLEVFRMSAYVSLPIVCFYLFNKPEYFKDYLIRNKRYYFSNEDPEAIAKLEEFKKLREKESELKLLAEIESLKKNKK
ncbi:unnamed protein product [Brachionus calyciflorus]|uniref:PET100 n=1 Tax=Brachionus calyciflorus TaxID=104777 RepID=A0A813QLJ9_9BILA|nr:unnamed protein product [Brachionus calyciflorus]